MEPRGWRRKHVPLGLLWAAILGLVVTGLYLYPGANLLDRLESRTVDWRFRKRGPLQPDPRLLLLTVDDRALTSLGAWPWPRQRWAEVVDRLQRAGAAAIVFDVFFSEPSGPGADAALAAATSRAGMVYHAAFASVEPSRRSGEDADGDGFALAAGGVSAGSPRASAALATLPGLQGPYPQLGLAARGIGFADVLDAGEGVYRYVFPVAQVGTALYPCLGLRVALDFRDPEGPQGLRVEAGKGVFVGDKLAAPLDRAGRMVINFTGPRGAYPRLSVADLLEDRLEEDRVEGRIVLVGVTAAGLKDLTPSPFGAVFEGLETQASILDSLLTGRFLWETDPRKSVLMILVGALLAGAAFSVLAPSRAALLCAVLLLGYGMACLWAFSHRGAILPLLPPSAGLALASVALLVRGTMAQERLSRRALGVLGTYLDPEVAQRVSAEESDVGQAVRCRVTVLFSDLRNFTAASARLDPVEVVALLNRYFGLMHETLREFDGTLDKYLGDGLMAYFCAPGEDTQHAALAVHAAVEMQKRIAANREEWAFHGMPDLRAGIGIATGNEVLGSLGASERLEYTVVGPRVNLASRLAELTKTLGADILIDENTYELARDYIDARCLGSVEVPGFSDPQQVYQALYHLAAPPREADPGAEAESPPAG